jgi:GT2 family glycosyltransferase
MSTVPAPELSPDRLPDPSADRTPDLSIVIVNWNTRGMLRDCLASAYAGLGSGLGSGRGDRRAEVAAEVIVVDNASDDGSAEMVEAEFPQAVLIRNAENRGFAAANNQGFAVARGRHVLLLNSDTVVHGDVLGRSVDWLDARPEVGAMGCRVLNTDGSVQLTCAMYPTILNQLLQTSGLWKLRRPRFFGRYLMTDWRRDSERAVETVSGCYLLVRARVIEEVGPLDEAFFFFGEETDWCRRMRDAGWKLMFAPVGEITHHGSASARKLNHRRDVMLSEALVRLHRKHGGVVPAAIVWLIAGLFNGSRAVFWSSRRLLGDQRAEERARHFRGVVAHLRDAWPAPPR